MEGDVDMIWLKIDSIETKAVEKIYTSYYDDKKYEVQKPEIYDLKVKIGDTVLEGRQMGTYCVVDDEKLNKTLEYGTMRKEIWEEAYKAGKEVGFKEGINKAIDMIDGLNNYSEEDTE